MLIQHNCVSAHLQMVCHARCSLHWQTDCLLRACLGVNADSVVVPCSQEEQRKGQVQPRMMYVYQLDTGAIIQMLR